MPKFSIVIPLYDEEECVERSAVDIVRELSREFQGNYEIILVVNGSRDRTGQICNDLAERYPEIRTVHTLKNLGYGGGIVTGFEAAAGDYFGFTCGDGQIAPQDLVKVIREIEQGAYDIVKTRRVTRGDGLIREVLSKVYNIIFHWLFNTSSQDINAMPKLMRRDVYHLLNLTSKDWFIDAEIMIKARHYGLQVKEIPVHYFKRIGGRSGVRFSTLFQFLRNAFYLIASGQLGSWRRPPHLRQEMKRDSGL